MLCEISTAVSLLILNVRSTAVIIAKLSDYFLLSENTKREQIEQLSRKINAFLLVHCLLPARSPCKLVTAIMKIGII